MGYSQLYYVKILIRDCNPQVTNTHNNYINSCLRYILFLIGILSLLVGTSEAICVQLFKIENLPLDILLLSNTVLNSSDSKFNQWLAGYIDGDGYFSYSKKGYVSLEITTQLRDKRTLYIIKQKLGGSIKATNKNHIRYRLHHKIGLIKQIEMINGEIRNPIRLLQFQRICDKYNIEMKLPQPLTYNNGWMSGLLDSDGSIYFNISSSQLFITIANNNKCLLDLLIPLYGGSIYLTNSSGLSFKWLVFKKEELLNLLNYFKVCSLYSTKLHRIQLIPHYFELRKIKAHLKSPETIEGKLWINFQDKQGKFSGDK